MPSTVVSAANSAEIVITRTFEAPRALVWRCYTDPRHVVHFWGPQGATNPVCEMDVRVGGVWRQVMRFASGNEYGYTSVYLEIDELRRLVWRDAPNDCKFGDALPPIKIHTTMELDAPDDRHTAMRVTIRFNSIAERDEAVRHGFARVITDSQEKFDAYVRTL